MEKLSTIHYQLSTKKSSITVSAIFMTDTLLANRYRLFSVLPFCKLGR
jgi:hypothetical protein